MPLSKVISNEYDLEKLYATLLQKSVDPMLLMSLVVDHRILRRDTTWGTVLLDIVKDYDLDSLILFVCKDVKAKLDDIMNCKIPRYNPFYEWNVNSDLCVETIQDKSKLGGGGRYIVRHDKASILNDFNDIVCNASVRNKSIIYPWLVQINREDEHDNKTVHRTFRMYVQSLQGLWCCARNFTSICDYKYLSTMECPLAVQGIRKFFIDWERCLSTMPVGTTVDDLRETALQTGKIICRILQEHLCLDADTVVCIAVKEGKAAFCVCDFNNLK